VRRDRHRHRPHLRLASQDAQRWGWLLSPLAAIGVLLGLRLLLPGLAVLLPEEAYYWMFSKHPALCYADHPPMVGGLILAGTTVFGDTEFGVRIGTWLLSVGSTYLSYRLVADWCGRRAGLAAAALFCTTPLLNGIGFFATPDTPLLFFWLWVLLAVTRATRSGSVGWWPGAGLGVGLAFASK
jgi:dolichol-phosphate mannosyltransferase